ncbi:MAG: hypothetical protein WA432_04955 [Candidatus Babeliaceae bacterium]
MKKLLLFVMCCLSAASAFGYTIQVFNNTGGKIVVVLDMMGRPNYNKTIAPGEQTWSQETVGWCTRGIKVSGVEGIVKGLYHEESTPGISCSSQKLTVDAINVIAVANPWTGKFEPKAQDMAFHWGIVP